jgi:hypothetical protein
MVLVYAMSVIQMVCIDGLYYPLLRILEVERGYIVKLR